MAASDIAKVHFRAAMEAAKAEGQDPDAVARAMLSCVVVSMLERRGAKDVQAELAAAAENVDPDTDYIFMRP